jgi:acetyltransferase-like isoleucine patch superfamily enzyme
LPLGDFRGLTLALAVAIFSWGYALVAYRALLRWTPLPSGEIPAGSRVEFVHNVYTLFYLVVFNPVMRSGLLPIPMTRPLYRALGARIGDNTYSSGIIYDAPFVELGSNCLIGEHALLIPHLLEGSRLALYPIRVGDGVTIGARVTVLPDVTIGDNAIVAAGSVVTKGSRIGAGEIWAGMPARPLLQRDASRTLDKG